MSEQIDFFPERGEVAALIRSTDWSRTPLGPPATWPPSLRTMLRVMLTSRFAMWLGWGPDLTLFYNDAYAQMTLGAKHPAALGQPFREVWAEIWETLRARVEHVLATGEATWDEGLLLFLERSGYPEETYHTFSYSPAPGEAPGEIGGLFCVVTEETARALDQRRLTLLRDLAALLSRVDSEDEAFGAVARCLEAEARDMPFTLAYLFDDDRKTARRVLATKFGAHHPAAPGLLSVDAPGPWPLQAALSGGKTIVVELDRAGGYAAWPTGAWKIPPSRALMIPLVHAGQSRPAGVFIAGMNPHRALDDSFESFVALFVGQLTAALSSVRAYDEERKRADALAEIDRAKTAFFSNVSHEFRTPLTLMLGPTEDALASPDRALRGAELETVHRNELRLLKLVNALLDFARIEAGRVKASYEPTDLAALTIDLASSFRSAIERAGLAFEVACTPLPEPIYVDHDMWEKIVLNLLSNALKFTFNGKITVALAWDESSRGARLTVTDTGAGIPDSELPRLFERFHRIEGTPSRTHEGSGIGLALVNELVALHGGTIRVSSQLGKGSTFAVALPSGVAHLPADRLAAGRERPSTPTSAAYVQEALQWTRKDEAAPHADEHVVGQNGRARILVADDNADMRSYVARLLGERWEVHTVEDGEAALIEIRRHPPDLVLSDVMMPKLDGFGLVRAIRADAALRSIPVILLSARAGEEAAAEGLGGGADDYIVKPFTARDLLVRVTSRLATAQAAREANLIRENLYRHFMQAPFAIAVFRGQEQIVELANAEILRFWGKGAEVVGQPLLRAVPELEGQPFLGWLADVLRRGVAHEGREEVALLPTGPDGAIEEAYFNFVYAPLRGVDGSVEGVLVSAFPVTEQVRARKEIESALARAETSEEALKQVAAERARALEETERVSRAKDEFLATMSHELRTPLNAMLGWATLLKSPDRDRAMLDRGLTVIERNAKAQARLVSDLLDVSRVISGKLRLAVKKTEVGPVIEAATDVVRQAAEAKALSLVVDIDPDTGALLADPDRLQQIVWNLLSNAVKFTPARGSVLVSARRVDSFVQIVVEDTGPGIPSEHLPFVFDRFRQIDGTTTRAHGGLGLGLAIVRHLVEAHGGTVSAESRGPGAGATFTVSLPIRAVHAPEPESLLPPAGAAEGGPSDRGTEAALPAKGALHGRHILAVDDDQDSLDLLRVVLEQAGAFFRGASSASRALEEASRLEFDAIVSDIGMPGMDGYALIRALRTRGASANVPAVALTAYARVEDADQALLAGFQRHMTKPVDAGALVDALAAMLRARAART